MRDFLNWHGDLFIYIFLFLLLFAGVFFGIAQLSEAQCAAKTESMGFDSRWSILGDCQIEVADGQWIPLESYYFKQE